MSPAALALVLTAAVMHAAWNFAAKRVRRDPVGFIWGYTVLSVVVWLPVAVVWTVVTHEPVLWSWVLAALVTSVLHIGYQRVLQHGYDVGDLNLVYPLARGTGPLVTFLVAITLLGERVGVVAVLGVALVVAGILVIAWAPRSGAGTVRVAAFWGVATGLSIAAYTLWDNFAVNHALAPPVPYFVLGQVFQSVILTAGVRPSRARVRAVWSAYRREAITVGVLSPLAYILVLRALQLAPVGLVAPARETSIVFGALLSWLVLKEPRPGRRLLAAAVVLAGIAALAVG